jgi:hypothetical protein
MAPRSWAGVVAKAPLKLPTGVRAALTMTTSSDMDISFDVLGLRFLDGGRPDGGPVSYLILLTSLAHVNRPGAKIAMRRIQNGAPDSFHSSAHALGLTVPHKTVAEPD